MMDPIEARLCPCPMRTDDAHVAFQPHSRCPGALCGSRLVVASLLVLNNSWRLSIVNGDIYGVQSRTLTPTSLPCGFLSLKARAGVFQI